MPRKSRPGYQAELNKAHEDRRYVDPVLLYRARNGMRVQLDSWAERLEVVKDLTDLGRPQREISRIIGRSERTVERYRHKINNNLGVGSESRGK